MNIAAAPANVPTTPDAVDLAFARTALAQAKAALSTPVRIAYLDDVENLLAGHDLMPAEAWQILNESRWMR
jgi:hypothetical protein